MFATQVFKGVRVLELAQFVFVPAAGRSWRISARM